MTACPTRQPFCKFAAPKNVVCCTWILCLPRRISVNIPYCKVQNMINIMIYHYILTNICLNLLHTLGKWQMTNMIHDLCSSGIKNVRLGIPPKKVQKQNQIQGAVSVCYYKWEKVVFLLLFLSSLLVFTSFFFSIPSPATNHSSVKLNSRKAQVSAFLEKISFLKKLTTKYVACTSKWM